VNSVPLQVLLYAFVAGASPVALGATLVVLGGRGGRWSALAFAIGVVLGQALVCAIAALIGNATLPVGHDAHETLRAVLELGLGVALLAVGVVVWARPPDRPARPDSRTRALLDRLAHLSIPSVFGAGALLTLGPKRLALTLLVIATISGGDVGTVGALSLVATYVIVATALVTVPVVLAIVFGERAERWMLSVEHWLSAHKRPLTVWPLVILGGVVVADAALALVA
jgi:threonine/homoserine/homoserine lactone efflux protein